jgi:hypothetical protein
MNINEPVSRCVERCPGLIVELEARSALRSSSARTRLKSGIFLPWMINYDFCVSDDPLFPLG